MACVVIVMIASEYIVENITKDQRIKNGSVQYHLNAAKDEMCAINEINMKEISERQMFVLGYVIL